jgi:hypothetical protein
MGRSKKPGFCDKFFRPTKILEKKPVSELPQYREFAITELNGLK